MNDEQVALARRGDPAATEALLREVAPRISAICRRICANPSDADDATQEALIAVVRGLTRFDGRSSLSTWVHRVATNAALDEVRRVRRRPVPAPEGLGRERPTDRPGPEEALLGADRRRDLRVALDQLPEEFRIAVVLRDVADLDYAEIAAILEVPVGTVRSRIARGRGRLADLLAVEPPRGNHSGAEDVSTPGTFSIGTTPAPRTDQ